MNKTPFTGSFLWVEIFGVTVHVPYIAVLWHSSLGCRKNPVCKSTDLRLFTENNFPENWLILKVTLKNWSDDDKSVLTFKTLLLSMAGFWCKWKIVVMSYHACMICRSQYHSLPRYPSQEVSGLGLSNVVCFFFCGSCQQCRKILNTLSWTKIWDGRVQLTLVYLENVHQTGICTVRIVYFRQEMVCDCLLA